MSTTSLLDVVDEPPWVFPEMKEAEVNPLRHQAQEVTKEDEQIITNIICQRFENSELEKPEPLSKQLTENLGDFHDQNRTPSPAQNITEVLETDKKKHKIS